MSDKYYLNTSVDGWPICKNSEFYDKKKIIEILNNQCEEIMELKKDLENKIHKAYRNGWNDGYQEGTDEIKDAHAEGVWQERQGEEYGSY